MLLSDSFMQMFEKANNIAGTGKSQNIWKVKEHEPSAPMKQLEVNANGTFWGFNHELVKNVKDITTRMSSTLEDKDCDGVAFLLDNAQQEHLVFVELKSNFDISKIAGAFHQITMSFIKMHAWLSLCKDYDIDQLKVHFITACKCYKDKDQEDNVMHRISQAQQLKKDTLVKKDTFETKFLTPLLKKQNLKVKLSSFDDIQKQPFHDSICNKELVMYLHLTAQHSDSETKVNLVI